jgi:hypothetical protein
MTMRKISTQRTLGSMLMVFEACVVFFATLVAFGLKVAPPQWVWGVGLGLTIAFLLTPAILGKRGSYFWGSLLQVITLLTGIAVPLMYFVGGIFVCLWIWAMVAGVTIDRARRAYEKIQAVAIQEGN